MLNPLTPLPPNLLKWNQQSLPLRTAQVRHLLMKDFVALLNPHVYEDIAVQLNKAELVQDHTTVLLLHHDIEVEFERLQKDGKTPPKEVFTQQVQRIAREPSETLITAYTGYVRECFPEKYGTRPAAEKK